MFTLTVMSDWLLCKTQNCKVFYGWSNVTKFNEMILCVQWNNYFDSTSYLRIQRSNYFIQRIIYIINEIIIYIFNEIIIFIQRIICIFNEIITFIQWIIYIFNELFTYSTKELFPFYQLNTFIQRMNWSIFIQPNRH